MKTYYKYLVLLVLLNILIASAGYTLIAVLKVRFLFGDIGWLLFFYSLITMICLYIFSRGQEKDATGRTMHLLIAFGLKFLLEMILAFFWFYIGKKTALSSLILFFVLYLAFTLFSALIMLKTLRTRLLENQN